MKDAYKTIGKPAEGVYREKGSRFLAFAYPAKDEEEIGSLVESLKKEYHDARHHCYAWRLGPSMDRYRINDDGEPSGSAGNPIFGQIRSRGLTQVLVVVVRYFGGTLLGVSGLIKAYRSAASDALDHAGTVERKVVDEWTLDFAYGQMNGVMRIIDDMGIGILKQDFRERCSMTIRIWQRQVPRAEKRFAALEDCHVRVTATGKL